MKKEIYTDTFSLIDLSASQKQTIINRLISIHQQIISNVDYNKFKAQIEKSRADNVTLHLYKNSRGEDVGFCILYRYAITWNGISTTVFRSDAGLLSKYRHRLSTLSFGLSYVLKYKLCHPFKNMIYCESFVHPSSYHLFYKYYPLVYPSPKKTTPEKLKELLKYLKKYFDFKPALSGSELCTHSGWITIDDDIELMQKKKLQYPDVAFFHEKNPKFTEGDGLLVLIPIKINYILRSFFTLIYHRLNK